MHLRASWTRKKNEGLDFILFSRNWLDYWMVVVCYCCDVIWV